MTEELTTVAITYETKFKLKKLAKNDKRSMTRYLETKLNEEYKKKFSQSIGNI